MRGTGDQPPFLEGVETRRLPCVVAVATSARFRWAEEVEGDPGAEPPPPYQGRGRPRRARCLEDRVPGYPANDLLATLPREAWQVIPGGRVRRAL